MKFLRHIFKRFNQLFWVFTDKIGFLLLSLFINIIVTRYLGKTDFGKLSYILSLFTFFAFIYEMGLRNLLVKEFLEKSDSRSAILVNSFLLRVVGFVIAYIIIFFYIVITEKDNSLRFMSLLFLLSIFFTSFNIIESLFYADSEFKKLIRFRFFVNLLIAAGKILMVVFKMKFYAFLYVYGADMVINGMLYYYLLKKYYPQIQWDLKLIDRKVLRHLLNQSMPYIISACMIGIYMKIDVLMLKALTTIENVALYSITVKFSEIYYFIPTAIATYYFPNLVKLKQTNELLYKKKIQEQFDVLVLIALIIALLTIVFSTTFIRILYGSAFHASAEALKIHILGGFTVFWAVSRARVMLIENMQRLIVFTEFTCAVTNIVLNIFLIPKYGIYGASAATVLTYVLGDYVVSYFLKPLRPYSLMLNRSLWNIVTLRVFSSIKNALKPQAIQ